MNTLETSPMSRSAAWAELIPPVARMRAILLAALLLLVYWQTIRHGMVLVWLNDGDWSHGPLIPLFSLYFLYTRRDQLARIEPRPSYAGVIVLALSLSAFFVSGWRLRMQYPQTLSLVGSIFGITLLLAGWGAVRVAWFPIAFLLLAIPLPKSLYVDLTMPLRQVASAVAAEVMPLLQPGLQTDAQAVVIDYIMPGMPPGTLNVEEACSGMRLMMAFIALGVAMAYLDERPLWHRIVMVLSCVPVAVFCNVIRVTTTGLLYVNGHEELARGTSHQLLGIATLAIALGLFGALRYVLSNLFVEAPSPGPERG